MPRRGTIPEMCEFRSWIRVVAWPLFFAAALLVGAVLPAGCATSPGSIREEVMPAAVADVAWMLVELGGEPVDGSGADRPPFIQFDASGRRFAGSGGVNRISGSILPSLDGAISIGPLVATRMAGSPESMELERSFIRVLERTYFMARVQRGARESLELLGLDRGVLARLEQ